MGMRQNWDLFVETTKAKSKGHMNSARDWGRINMMLSLSLILLGAITTFLALMPAIPSLVVAGLAGLGTMLSTVAAFLRPGDHRQTQVEASKEFKSLMMKMVRCETELEYENLWKDFNKALMDEPFLPKKYVSNVEMEWTITPELLLVIKEKDDEINEAFNDSSNQQQNAESEDGENLLSRDFDKEISITMNAAENTRDVLPNLSYEMDEKTYLLEK